MHKTRGSHTIVDWENYPLEYHLGKVTFYGREFLVTPDVLIPRLETEGLVRRAREVWRQWKYEFIIDIGSGSGIIWTSLADMADEVIFIDISPEAMAITQQNFRKYYKDKSAKFIIWDLLDSEELWTLQWKNILLLANLPYIKKDDWEHMSPDTKHEPELALFGGETTGFELYERLFLQIREWQYRGVCIIEFGFDQREIAKNTIQKFGWNFVFFPDFAGIERFAQIYLTN